MSWTSGATAASRAWVMTRRWPEGRPLANTVPSGASTIAASEEFCPAAAMRTPVMGPVRASIACFSAAGRSSHAMRGSTTLLTPVPKGDPA